MRVVSPPGKGRRPAPIAYGEPRYLTEADVAKMWEGGGTQGLPRLKALRYNHHLLAKAVASGKSLLECSRLTGLTVGRISDLKNDPAFQELVSFYAEELHEVYVDVHQRMASLGTSVLEELQERFETEPEKFTKRELLEMFTTMADRSIATAKGGPKPQQAQATVAGAGLALQINFVSPQGETLDLTGIPQALPEGAEPASAKLGLTATRSPDDNPLTSTSSLAVPADSFAALPPASDFYPEGVGLDGEPVLPAPAPFPASAEVEAARFEAIGESIERRQREAEERDRLRAEALAARGRI